MPLIAALSNEGAVYAFDDYEGKAKGVVNVNKLQPQLKGYALITPPADVARLDSSTTIACLVPA